MNEIIDRILDGKFDYENSVLEFSKSKIELTIFPGESYEGSFIIMGCENKLLEGFVFSSDSRMECLNHHFLGNGEEISFIFHGNHMEEGDVAKGNFQIVSSQGEYSLPFAVMVSYTTLESSLGSIKNLFHFANLAKSNWQEAVRIFYDPLFERIFQGHEKQYLDRYLALSKYPMDERNVEAFLIAIHKKQIITYIIDEDKITLDATGVLGRLDLLLTRNGWGYTNLQIEAAGGFISLEKEALTDDDFLGNRCTVHFFIDKEKLYNGINFGSIRFFNSFTEVSIPVEVNYAKILEKDFSIFLSRQKTIDLMMRDFLAFRTRALKKDEWLEKTNSNIDVLHEIDENDPVPGLFQAQLLMSQERYNEADWTLDHAKTMILQSDNKSQEIWDYYLYLTTLSRHDPEYVQEITDEIESNYRQHAENWRLGWLLLFLSRELNVSISARWLFLQEQYEHGCTSPFIYVEAWVILKNDPTLLMRLDGFEMQVLSFAAKNQLLTFEMVQQLHYLISRCNDKSGSLYRLLTQAYMIRQDAETLSAICSLLIRENRQENKFFMWYARGVEENIRITKLYEYYMYSLDLTQQLDLPKVIFMYFAYNNTLDYEHTAYLYANLVQRKAELPDLYEKSQFQIQDFVMSMIRRRRISHDLAFLYQEVLDTRMLDDEIREVLSSLYFSRLIRLHTLRSGKLIVRQPHLIHEQEYVLHDDWTIVPVYEEDAVLIYEDGSQNRDVLEEDQYDVEFLFQSEPVLQALAAEDDRHLGLQLYLCRNENHDITINPYNATRFETIALSEEIAPDYREEIILKLVSYYADNHLDDKLDLFLEYLKPEMFQAIERAEIIRYLTSRDKQQKAFEWICNYGFLHLNTLTAARLASLMTEQIPEDDKQSEMLLFLCYYAYVGGQYDGHTLQYLADHYEGPTKNLRDIWKSCQKSAMDVHLLSERILIQMLFTGFFVGEKMEIFKSYLKSETALPVEKAFLSQCAYDYFVKDKVTEEIVFEDMEKLLLQGEKLQKVCMLAYTKYYADFSDSLGEERRQLLENALTALQEEGIILPYFAMYHSIIPFMGNTVDKTVIEYKTRPGTKTIIHYMLEHKETSGEEYHTREMRDIYGGVFVTEFVLFFGEKLFYYITEDTQGKEEPTESESVSRADIGADSTDRFSMLNDIMISETLQDYDTMQQLMLDYDKLNYVQNSVFRLI